MRNLFQTVKASVSVRKAAEHEAEKEEIHAKEKSVAG